MTSSADIRLVQNNIQIYMNSQSILHCLSDKLQNANRTVLLEKKKDKEEIEERLKALQITLQNKKKFQNESIAKTKNTVDHVNTLTTETLKNFNLKAKKEEQLVRNLKEQIENDIELQQRQHENRIQAIAEKQTENMTASMEVLNKQAKIKKEKQQKLINETKKNLSLLERDFQDEADSRIENCQRIKEDIQQEIELFSTQIQRQQKRRAESDKKISKLMGQINEKLIDQIQSEEEKRKKNNGSLLKLIQLACHKLQEKIQS